MSYDSAGRDEILPMTDDDFKRLMAAFGMPDSHSLLSILKQVENHTWQAALSRQAAQGGEAVAWRSTGFGFKRFVTDAWYQKQPAKIRIWYEPFECANCCAPPDTVPRAELNAAVRDFNQALDTQNEAHAVELSKVVAELEQYRKDAERFHACLKIMFDDWHPVSVAYNKQPPPDTEQGLIMAIDRAMQEAK